MHTFFTFPLGFSHLCEFGVHEEATTDDSKKLGCLAAGVSIYLAYVNSDQLHMYDD